MNQPNDPLVRLARVEQTTQNLINNINNLLSENSRLKARVKTLEVECGLVADDSGEDDLEG